MKSHPKLKRVEQEVIEEEEVVEEEEEIPDPNGVYLPVDKEEKNGKPVYTNGNGFFLWYNGSIWKITDKIGGGKSIATGNEFINDKWSGGARSKILPK